jgi:hypothetical protein
MKLKNEESMNKVMENESANPNKFNLFKECLISELESLENVWKLKKDSKLKALSETLADLRQVVELDASAKIDKIQTDTFKLVDQLNRIQNALTFKYNSDIEQFISDKENSSKNIKNSTEAKSALDYSEFSKETAMSSLRNLKEIFWFEIVKTNYNQENLIGSLVKVQENGTQIPIEEYLYEIEYGEAENVFNARSRDDVFIDPEYTLSNYYQI